MLSETLAQFRAAERCVRALERLMPHHDENAELTSLLQRRS
jgi:hypothetical protein